MFSFSLAKRSTSFLAGVAVFLIAGCGGGGSDAPVTTTPPAPTAPAPTAPPPSAPVPPPVTSTTRNVTISWAKNTEKRVSEVGGGYRVYISQVNGFSINSSGVEVVNVPASATATPISVIRALPAGTHFFKVVAYSRLGTSVASRQTTVTVTIP